MVLPRGVIWANPFGSTVPTRHRLAGKAVLMCSWRILGMVANRASLVRPLEVVTVWSPASMSAPPGRDYPAAHRGCRLEMLSSPFDENGRRVPGVAPRRPPGLDHGRRPDRRRHGAPGHTRDRRRVRRLVRPPLRPGVARHRPHTPRCRPAPHALVLRPAEERGRAAGDGPLLLGDDLPERRQHHAHPRVRQSDRARHPRRGPAAERLAGADRERRAASRRDRRHRALSHVLGRRRHDRLPHAREPSRARSAAARPRDRFWHQLYGWLSKAEFTLGLALACTHAMGLVEHEPSIEYLIDLIVDVQTVRSCTTAAELDPEVTAEGYCIPNRSHIGAGSIAVMKARQRMAEILRILPGSSLVVAPSDKDLAAPEVGAGLAESFEGGGYTALQRAALLQLACDHVASALDGRESTFELHANGGVPAWRGRLRKYFGRYNELANGVLRALNVDMPEIDLDILRAAPLSPRRPVTPPTPKAPPPASA